MLKATLPRALSPLRRFHYSTVVPLAARYSLNSRQQQLIGICQRFLRTRQKYSTRGEKVAREEGNYEAPKCQTG